MSYIRRKISDSDEDWQRSRHGDLSASVPYDYDDRSVVIVGNERDRLKLGVPEYEYLVAASS